MPFQPTAYDPYDFANRRHIGPSPEEMARMLDAVGADSLDQLIEQTVPTGLRQETPLTWAPVTEGDLLVAMRAVGRKNRVLHSLIGQGYYGTVTPPAIQRNILENPAWYTAYTPYQPEIAQGRLEALLNFQTMIADLTGLAFGVLVDLGRFIHDGLVDLDHLTVDGGGDVGGGLDRFDHHHLVALGDLSADLGQFDEDDIAELFLGMVGDADGDGVAIEAQPFMVFGKLDHSRWAPQRL